MAPVHEQDLARSFRVFQQHVKNNGLTHEDLLDALNAQSANDNPSAMPSRLIQYVKE